MRKNFRYRVVSGDDKALQELMVSAAYVWNYALTLQRKYHEWYGKYLSVNRMMSFVAKRQRANFYAHVTWRREDWQWKTAHWLCRQFDVIKIEDLCIKGWVAMWGRKASDLAIGSFIQKLEQVAIKYGTKIIKVDRWFASSQTCSSCGHKLEKKLTLNDRQWQCPSCGETHSRDINAATNIKRWEPTCVESCKSPLNNSQGARAKKRGKVKKENHS